uniref:Pyridoxal kinase n=1 Tax=Clastoptera arizonana TaxID=38151 RepID=A0A1B6ED04_9HEMI
METKPFKVLSIQGHVVSGYVGNSCAAFVLQVLGFEVDAINSVQISNQGSFGSWKGVIFTEKNLADLMEDLESKGFDKDYTHLLTGYVASPSFLNYIEKVVKQLRKNNPDLIYVCDPVLGVNGKLYVPESLIEIYREKILPLADIVIPNQYEAELLTGKPILDAEDAWTAIENLHSAGCTTVVISSTHLGYDNYLLAFGSTMKGKIRTTATIKTPLLDATFIGTGDLFSALFLAWMSKTNNNLPTALEMTTATVQAVLERTIIFAKNAASLGRKPVKNRMPLKLVQSKADIEEPKVIIRCKSGTEEN